MAAAALLFLLVQTLPAPLGLSVGMHAADCSRGSLRDLRFLSSGMGLRGGEDSSLFDVGQHSSLFVDVGQTSDREAGILTAVCACSTYGEPPRKNSHVLRIPCQ